MVCRSSEFRKTNCDRATLRVPVVSPPGLKKRPSLPSSLRRRAARRPAAHPPLGAWTQRAAGPKPVPAVAPCRCAGSSHERPPPTPESVAGRLPGRPGHRTAGVAEPLLAEQVRPATERELTVGDLCDRYARKGSAVRAWLEAGRFPGAYKLNGRDWRIPLVALAAVRGGAARRAGQGGAGETKGPGANLGAWRGVRGGPAARRGS
jgi:hypothetical protein